MKGLFAEVQCDRVQGVLWLKTTPAPTLAPQDADGVSEDNDEENGAPASTPPARKKLTIWVPGRYCPRA